MESLPHPALRDHIRCYWRLNVSGAGSNGGIRFLNEGMELAFILGGALPGAVEKGEVVVSGPMTRPMGFAPTDAVRILGVCFRPGGGYRYFRFPAWELCDGTADITDLCGATGRQLFDRLGGRVDGGKENAAIFDRFFLRLAERSRHEDSEFEAALSAVVLHQGQVRIGRLAGSLGASRRILEGKFRERVGMSPKRLCRNLRFKQALKRMDCAPKEPWTEIAWPADTTIRPT